MEVVAQRGCKGEWRSATVTRMQGVNLCEITFADHQCQTDVNTSQIRILKGTLHPTHPLRPSIELNSKYARIRHELYKHCFSLHDPRHKGKGERDDWRSEQRLKFLLDSQNYNEAIATYHRRSQSSWTNKHFLGLADCYIRTGRWEEAVVVLRNVQARETTKLKRLQNGFWPGRMSADHQRVNQIMSLTLTLTLIL